VLRTRGGFRSEFDHVVLLTAPVQVTLERLATRTTNPFGKRPDERAKILADKADIEPMLRADADLVVETTEPVEATVQRLLDLLAP
jgi:dephospho-CoA kinase